MPMPKTLADPSSSDPAPLKRVQRCTDDRQLIYPGRVPWAAHVELCGPRSLRRDTSSGRHHRPSPPTPVAGVHTPTELRTIAATLT